MPSTEIAKNPETSTTVMGERCQNILENRLQCPRKATHTKAIRDKEVSMCAVCDPVKDAKELGA